MSQVFGGDIPILQEGVKDNRIGQLAVDVAPFSRLCRIFEKGDV